MKQHFFFTAHRLMQPLTGQTAPIRYFFGLCAAGLLLLSALPCAHAQNLPDSVQQAAPEERQGPQIYTDEQGNRVMRTKPLPEFENQNDGNTYYIAPQIYPEIWSGYPSQPAWPGGYPSAPHGNDPFNHPGNSFVPNQFKPGFMQPGHSGHHPYHPGGDSQFPDRKPFGYHPGPDNKHWQQPGMLDKPGGHGGMTRPGNNLRPHSGGHNQVHPGAAPDPHRQHGQPDHLGGRPDRPGSNFGFPGSFSGQFPKPGHSEPGPFHPDGPSGPGHFSPQPGQPQFPAGGILPGSRPGPSGQLGHGPLPRGHQHKGKLPAYPQKPPKERP
ncbi:MAG: hypothetical protein IJD04_01040 [Desulfovibrionaceae bacterium]|nr:hypothetical protein [Desulfovibrionaceae bacterium]